MSTLLYMANCILIGGGGGVGRPPARGALDYFGFGICSHILTDWVRHELVEMGTTLTRLGTTQKHLII